MTNKTPEYGKSLSIDDGLPSVPKPPVKPLHEEYCGSGCAPCIFDYYYDQLEAWKTKYGLSQVETSDD